MTIGTRLSNLGSAGKKSKLTCALTTCSQISIPSLQSKLNNVPGLALSLELPGKVIMPWTMQCQLQRSLCRRGRQMTTGITATRTPGNMAASVKLIKSCLSVTRSARRVLSFPSAALVGAATSQIVLSAPTMTTVSIIHGTRSAWNKTVEIFHGKNDAKRIGVITTQKVLTVNIVSCACKSHTIQSAKSIITAIVIFGVRDVLVH